MDRQKLCRDRAALQRIWNHGYSILSGRLSALLNAGGNDRLIDELDELLNSLGPDKRMQIVRAVVMRCPGNPTSMSDIDTANWLFSVYRGLKASAKL